MSSVSADFSHLESRLKSSIIDDFAQKQVFKYFENITYGKLVFTINNEIITLGNPDEVELVASIQVHNRATFRQIMLNGMIGAAEMFMLGAWTTPDLLSVVRLMCQNINLLNDIDRSRNWLTRASSALLHWANQNTLSGSAKNISAHYDLSNDFFETFLDQTMMYSSAVFSEEHNTLESAATHKLDLICQKLQLCPDDKVIEIGTGWGGMAIHAASHYGCHVTTTTISSEQYNYTCEKVAALGLDDKITVLKQDYRELEGKFDKLISIEMIEAVGHRFYQSYFEQCSKLLNDNGQALIQAITISDQRYDDAKNDIDFIQRYIFPGGCLPSVSVIANCVASHTDMQIVDLHDITADYATTLDAWHQRFNTNIDVVKALGFDDIFCRMWQYYLCYCEGGFRERIIQTSQILMSKPLARNINTSCRS